MNTLRRGIKFVTSSPAVRSTNSALFYGQFQVRNAKLTPMEHKIALRQQKEYLDSLEKCKSNRDGAKADQIIAGMIQQGIKPLPEAYLLAVDACIESNRIDRAFQFLDEMTQQEIEPDSALLDSLIKASRRDKDLKRAEHLFRTMISSAIIATPDNYNSLLEVYVDADPKKGLEFAGWLQTFGVCNARTKELEEVLRARVAQKVFSD